MRPDRTSEYGRKSNDRAHSVGGRVVVTATATASSSVVRVPMVEPPPDAENSTVLAERSLPPSVEYGIFSVLGIAVSVRFRRSISLVLWYPWDE